MKNYSIVRIGNDYVVQADEKSILKIASRRRAARLISDATELLELQAAPTIPSGVHNLPSTARDPQEIADPRITPDPYEVP